MKYNTNDLVRARYTYSYTINNNIDVMGERDGVLYFNNDVYVDLIAEQLVDSKDILKIQGFNARDNEVSLSSIRKIFESLEDYYENMAFEKQVGKISKDIPTTVSFKASEMNHALESMVKEKVSFKSKILSKFKK